LENPHRKKKGREEMTVKWEGGREGGREVVRARPDVPA